VVFDSGFPLGAKLSTIIREGNWHWHFARSKAIVGIQSKLAEVIIGSADLPVWNSSNGIYYVGGFEREEAPFDLVEACVVLHGHP